MRKGILPILFKCCWLPSKFMYSPSLTFSKPPTNIYWKWKINCLIHRRQFGPYRVLFTSVMWVGYSQVHNRLKALPEEWGVRRVYSPHHHHLMLESRQEGRPQKYSWYDWEPASARVRQWWAMLLRIQHLAQGFAVFRSRALEGYQKCVECLKPLGLQKQINITQLGYAFARHR